MPKYTCPKCGQVGYLVMAEDKNFETSKFSYRIRMIHHPKGGKQTLCHLVTLDPRELRKKEPKSKEAKGNGGDE